MPSQLAGLRRRGAADFFKIYGPAVLVTLVGFAVAWQFVDPAPPRRIVLATGHDQGAYYLYGRRYQAILARDGIEVVLRETAGSVENLRLLASGGADAAFVQGGVGDPAEAPGLRALGSLYYEPLWIFHRAAVQPDTLRDLRGLSIAVGADGSGTQPVARELLGFNGIGESEASLHAVEGPAAIAGLLTDTLDVAFFVNGPDAPIVRGLLATRGIELMGLRRAPAYARLDRALSVVQLPEGVLDPATDTPPRELSLVAPAATLAAAPALHPAIGGLLLRAAREVHGEGGLFESQGEFPSPRYVDFPLADEARRFYESGPPLLQRYLPFWAATLLDRLKVMLVPLLTLLVPLFKIVPPTYRWRIRSRIYRWYRELQTVEQAAAEPHDAARRERLLAELDRIDQDVHRVSVPLAYMDELYGLRLHIDFVRRLVNGQRTLGEA